MMFQMIMQTVYSINSLKFNYTCLTAVQRPAGAGKATSMEQQTKTSCFRRTWLQTPNDDTTSRVFNLFCRGFCNSQKVLLGFCFRCFH
ncbi:hypothetical protein C5167_013966 [Papaver somniferum]|uniref:Uncharacterized protein n=1 Tax=Papaver somniferum TaxID=3469 RepID=A0A4Y7J5A2_PAPSO|nr:hypothetical protein C5167_013966 [Papaver somniferum]